MDKKNIYIAQFTSEHNIFGSNKQISLLPLSAGLLVSRLKKEKELPENSSIQEILFKRENPEQVASRIENALVVGFSCYLWNKNYSLEVAQKVKNKHLDSLIVFGGPDVPWDYESGRNFLEKHKFIDVICRGEGEEVFARLCDNHSKGKSFEDINGIIHRNKKGNIISTEVGKSLILEDSHSPYIDGTFSELYSKYKDEFSGALLEITRGCPYKCDYCSWGGLDSRILRDISIERIKGELKWIGENKIEYVALSDANFGINNRNLEFVELLIDYKNKYGYPNYISTSWAKNPSEKVFDIIKMLKDNNIGFRTSLSLQSLNENVVKEVNRANIKKEDFDEIRNYYNKNSAHSYTELILGLPFESYESFTSGLESLFDKSVFHEIQIFPLYLLPNTKLTNSKNREKYGFISREVECACYEAINDYKIKEFVEVVVGTKDMPPDKWIDTFVSANYMLSLYDKKSAFFVLRYLKEKYQISINDFVDFLYKSSIKNPLSVIRSSFNKLKKRGSEIQNEGKSYKFIPRFYEIPFDPPEGIFLELLMDKKDFFTEFFGYSMSYLSHLSKDFNKSELEDLFRFQEAIIVNPNGPPKKTLQLNYNWDEYFKPCFNLKKLDLKPIQKKLRVIDPPPYGYSNRNFIYHYLKRRNTLPFYNLINEEGNLIFPLISK